MVLRRLLSHAISLFVAASLPGQEIENQERFALQLQRSIPVQGAQAVPLDRSTSLFFNVALDASRLNEDSFLVVSEGAVLPIELSLSQNRKVVTIRYPFFLPGESRITVIIKPEGLGYPPSDRLTQIQLEFWTDVAVDVPTPIGTGVIIGYVFDINGVPIPGVQVEGFFFPRASDQDPPIPGLGVLTDFQGRFEYTTPSFQGLETFLIEIGDGHALSAAQRQVEVGAGGCIRVDDAMLQVLAPRVMVTAAAGAMLMDPTGQVRLEIPAGALTADSEIGLTILQSEKSVRDELPRLVAPGLYVDISGVFGDATNLPVTLRVPNTYNLPIGTEIPFGKIDHNTLEWSDLRDLPGSDASFLGHVVDDGNGGTVIEVQFNEFCHVCTGHCKPCPGANCADPKPKPRPPSPPCNPAGSGGNSFVSHREGYLWEDFELPSVLEFGEPFALSFGYFSAAAEPSTTMSSSTNFDSSREVEGTEFEYNIEGVLTRALYDRRQTEDIIGNYIWDGRNDLGQLLPTGIYPFELTVRTFNANQLVSLPAAFGGTAIQSFAGVEYPGSIVLESKVDGATLLINLQDSCYGAGWSLMNEARLYFGPDPDEILLLEGNAEARLFQQRFVLVSTLPPRGRVGEAFPPDPGPNYAWRRTNQWLSFGDSLTFNTVTAEWTRVVEDGEVQHFNQAGRLVRRVVRGGYETNYSYAGDLLTTITTPTGYFFTFNYDGNGKLTSVQDSVGRTTTIDIDANGDMVGFRIERQGDPKVYAERSFSYDQHRLTAQQRGAGQRTEYLYQNGRVVQADAYDKDDPMDPAPPALLRSTKFAPSVLNGEIGAALARGQGTFLSPIPIVTGRINLIIDARGVVSTSESDNNGNVVSEIDGLGRETNFFYGQNDLLHRIDWPLRQGATTQAKTRLRFDRNSTRISQIEEFDEAGVFYSREEFTYGPFGQLLLERDQEGHETRRTYDATDLAARSLLVVTNALGEETRFTYGDSRFPTLPTREVAPDGVELAYTYDAHGNLASLTDFPDPAGRVSSVQRDSAGNITARTTGVGTRRATYDALNRLISHTNAELQVHSFGYDDLACGCDSEELTRVVFPGFGSPMISCDFDGLGRLTERIDQNGMSSLFSHDANGNLLSSVDRSGRRLDFEYDLANQMVRVNDSSGLVTSYTYDAHGGLLTGSDPFCRLSFERDFLGQETSVTSVLDLDVGQQGVLPIQHTLQYQYDRVGNRTLMTIDAGDAQEYDYDAANRLVSLRRPGSGDEWTIAYLDGGMRRSISNLRTGLTTSYSYDPAGQPLRILLRQQQTDLLSLNYDEYDGEGNVTRFGRSLGQAGFRGELTALYDGDSQLIEVRAPNVFGDQLVAIAASFDAANRLDSDGEWVNTHDGEGRLIQRDQVGTQLRQSFAHDSFGKMVRYEEELVGQGLITEIKYAYDPLGRRIAKTVEGVTSLYVYDGLDIIQELDGRGRIERTFTHGLRIDEPLALHEPDGGSLYYHGDRLGSIVAISDDMGVLISEILYDEFGQVLGEGNPLMQAPYGYTGRERDLETGLMHYRSRTYAPSNGRFLVEDLIGLMGGLNQYRYVGNNPLNGVDPLGELKLSPGARLRKTRPTSDSMRRGIAEGRSKGHFAMGVKG